MHSCWHLWRPIALLALLGPGWSDEAPAPSPLRWETQTLRLQANWPQPAVEGRFRFTVAGTAPVTIAAVNTSCGCTVVDFQPGTFAPGQQGELPVRMSLEVEEGVQSRKVYVRCVPDQVETLVVEATVHRYLHLEPNALSWRAGQSRTSRDIRIEAATPTPVHVLEVRNDNPAFRLELQTQEPGRRYRLRVTPPAGEPPQRMARLTVRTDFPVAAPIEYPLYAQVLSLPDLPLSTRLFKLLENPVLLALGALLPLLAVAAGLVAWLRRPPAAPAAPPDSPANPPPAA